MYSRFHFPLCVAALWGAAVAVAWAEGAPASFNAGVRADVRRAHPLRNERQWPDARGAYRHRGSRSARPRAGAGKRHRCADGSPQRGRKTIAYADNPLRRWAIQRITIDTAASRSFELAAVGKERAQGQVSRFVCTRSTDSAPPTIACVRCARRRMRMPAMRAVSSSISPPSPRLRAMPSARTRLRSTGMSGRRRCSNAAVQWPRKRGPRRNTPQRSTRLRRYAEARVTAQRASAAFAAAGGGLWRGSRESDRGFIRDGGRVL